MLDVTWLQLQDLLVDFCSALHYKFMTTLELLLNNRDTCYHQDASAHSQKILCYNVLSLVL